MTSPLEELAKIRTEIEQVSVDSDPQLVLLELAKVTPAAIAQIELGLRAVHEQLLEVASRLSAIENYQKTVNP